MKIKLTLPEKNAEYIRHARLQTLESIGAKVSPEVLEPVPFGMYLLAYGDDESKPLGMIEGAFYNQIYDSFEHSPHPESFRLSEFGDFESFVGTRTIYVEPEARDKVPPYYLMLSIAGCQMAHQLGARFSTASTLIENDNLIQLYRKTGGKCLGSYEDKEQAKSEIIGFIFEMEKLINHPATRRLADKVEIDPKIVETIRSRNLTVADNKIGSHQS